MLRSAYSVDMRFDETKPDDRKRVRWYFVQGTKEELGYSTPFASRVWEPKEFPQAQLGEVYGSQKWANGKKPFVAEVGAPCGEPLVWTNGAMEDTQNVALQSEVDVSACCEPAKPDPFALDVCSCNPCGCDSCCEEPCHDRP